MLCDSTSDILGLKNKKTMHQYTLFITGTDLIEKLDYV